MQRGLEPYTGVEYLFEWGSHFLFLLYILEGQQQCVLGDGRR